ncbi:MAG: carbon storage regulator [Planctomycetales bacterium]
MLVLTRKKAEEIRIGENITIKVIRCGKGTVKIGIDAPDHVRVLRAELCLDPAEAEARLAEDLDEESDQQAAGATESDRLPEVDAGDLAQFAALIYPQAV